MTTDMRRTSRGTAAILALALGAGTGAAAMAGPAPAPQERPSGMRAPTGEMRTGLRRLQDRFEANSPAPGERFPNLTLYDSDGNKVRMKDMVRGHYTVVVLGCLT